MSVRRHLFAPCAALAIAAGSVAFAGQAYARFPAQIKNVVIIVQENRTPDNLFHNLPHQCALPSGGPVQSACTPTNATSSCYDISPCGLSNDNGLHTVTLTPIPLTGTICKEKVAPGATCPSTRAVDPAHTHAAFEKMCDPDPVTLACRNDGAWRISMLDPTAGHYASYAFAEDQAVTNSDGSAGTKLEPYLRLAEQYGWANAMYQTNQGPSYNAHQFLFSGTSAPTALLDRFSIFVAENFDDKVGGNSAGCLAPATSTNSFVLPAPGGYAFKGCTLYDGNSVQECTVSNFLLSYPSQPVGLYCYPHRSMASLLDPARISWKYYATTPGDIWTAPDSFQQICQPRFAATAPGQAPTLTCTGSEFAAKVDTVNHGTDILRDISSCNLARVSWVTPDGAWSDHSGENDRYGPSWVASIVNAIGNNPTCAAGTSDAGQKFWTDTAVIVTWDDWGGWSDHRPATSISALPCTSFDCQGDYQRGFRVPLLVVSAYTPPMIDDLPHDFGSILRMVEGIDHLPEGALGFADARARTDLSNFFTLATPRAYETLPSEEDASFFLNYAAPSTAPDND